jgi:Peptidase family M50
VTTIPAHPRGEPTPILDREAPLPDPAPAGSGMGIVLGFHLALWSALALGTALGVPPILRRWILEDLPAWLEGQRSELATPRGLAWVLVSSIAALYAMVAIHELGHVLVGRAMGFRMQSLRIGPVELQAGRLRLHRRLGLATSGVANIFPTQSDHLALRSFAMVAAGPLANVVSGCAVLFLPIFHGIASAVFVAASIGNALSDFLPFENRIGVSDGRRLWMLLRDRPRAERWLALMQLQAKVRDGLMPEAWPADLLARATAVRDVSAETVTAHGFAYASAFHRRDDATAARCLETSLQHSSRVARPVRDALISDAAVFQARRRNRIDLAQRWLEDLSSSTASPWLRLRAEAAILEARGEARAAASKLDEIGRLVEDFPDRRQREWLLSLLGRWRSDLAASAS